MLLIWLTGENTDDSLGLLSFFHFGTRLFLGPKVDLFQGGNHVKEQIADSVRTFGNSCGPRAKPRSVFAQPQVFGLRRADGVGEFGNTSIAYDVWQPQLSSFNFAGSRDRDVW